VGVYESLRCAGKTACERERARARDLEYRIARCRHNELRLPSPGLPDNAAAAQAAYIAAATMPETSDAQLPHKARDCAQAARAAAAIAGHLCIAPGHEQDALCWAQRGLAMLEAGPAELDVDEMREELAVAAQIAAKRAQLRTDKGRLLPQLAPGRRRAPAPLGDIAH
jgi:hypothetical protein